MQRFNLSYVAVLAVGAFVLASGRSDAGVLNIDFIGQTNPDTVFVTNNGLTKVAVSAVQNTIISDVWEADTTASGNTFYYTGTPAALVGSVGGAMSINVLMSFDSAKLPSHFSDFNIEMRNGARRMIAHINGSNIAIVDTGVASQGVAHGVDLTESNLFSWVLDPGINAQRAQFYVNGVHMGQSSEMLTTSGNGTIFVGDTDGNAARTGSAWNVEWIRYANDTVVVPEPATGLAALAAIGLLATRSRRRV